MPAGTHELKPALLPVSWRGFVVQPPASFFRHTKSPWPGWERTEGTVCCVDTQVSGHCMPIVPLQLMKLLPTVQKVQ